MLSGWGPTWWSGTHHDHHGPDALKRRVTASLWEITALGAGLKARAATHAVLRDGLGLRAVHPAPGTPAQTHAELGHVGLTQPHDVLDRYGDHERALALAHADAHCGLQVWAANAYSKIGTDPLELCERCAGTEHRQVAGVGAHCPGADLGAQGEGLQVAVKLGAQAPAGQNGKLPLLNLGRLKTLRSDGHQAKVHSPGGLGCLGQRNRYAWKDNGEHHAAQQASEEARIDAKEKGQFSARASVRSSGAAQKLTLATNIWPAK